VERHHEKDLGSAHTYLGTFASCPRGLLDLAAMMSSPGHSSRWQLPRRNSPMVASRGNWGRNVATCSNHFHTGPWRREGRGLL